jgi:hypothetical protein
MGMRCRVVLARARSTMMSGSLLGWVEAVAEEAGGAAAAAEEDEEGAAAAPAVAPPPPDPPTPAAAVADDDDVAAPGGIRLERECERVRSVDAAAEADAARSVAGPVLPASARRPPSSPPMDTATATAREARRARSFHMLLLVALW